MTITFTLGRSGSRDDDLSAASDRAKARTEQSEGDRIREEIFSGFVDAHGPLMYKVAFSVLRNTHDAEDAVQTALLKVYRTGAWERMHDAKAFLARTVWRVALDRLSRRKELALEAHHEQILDIRTSPEADAIRTAQAKRLRRMIDGLPEELRQVLLLSAIEELNSREVGLLVGIPEGTVRTRLMRARTQLRVLLESKNGGSDARV